MIFILYILWFIFNGRFTAETAVVGFAVCSAIYFGLCRLMGYSLKKDISALKKIHVFIVFFIFVLIHVIISNINVIRIILSAKKKPESEIVTFNAGLKEFNTKCLFANSITITPGTYTIGLKNGVYTVHALTPDFSKHLLESKVLKCVKKMEEKRV